jgi:hypothetical protein
VKSLPYLVRIAPGTPIARDGAVSVAKADVMDASTYPWDAEAIAAFIQDRSGVSVGEIVRPVAVRSRFVPLFTLAFLAGAAYVGSRWTGELGKSRWFNRATRAEVLSVLGVSGGE